MTTPDSNALMMAGNIGKEEVAIFADALHSVIVSCNGYFSNQIPDNALQVVGAAKQLCHDFSSTSDENIIHIVNSLQKALEKPFNDDTEGAIIQEIRSITDIIEPNNLVLTFKDDF